MIGIDIESLDKIIKLNNMNSEDIDSYIKKIINSISELDECYSGRSLDFLFTDLLEQRNSLTKISKVIRNYSTVLSDVKTSYVKQDQEISDYINHVKS